MTLIVLMTTYYPDDERGEQRRRIARGAMGAIQRRLALGLNQVGLHIADDGSPDYDQDWKWWVDNWRGGGPVTLSYQNRGGVGASFNAAIRAHPEDVLLYIVDDWYLDRPFNIWPWLEMLEADESVGCVRLFPHPHLRGTVEMWTGGWRFRYDLGDGFAVAMRPALWHPRFWETFGQWPEGRNAFDTESIFNTSVGSMARTLPNMLPLRRPVPGIVEALPTYWHHHHDSPELGDIEPRP